MPPEHLMPEVCFKLGQRVIERFGNDDATAQLEEVEIVSRSGREVITETGATFDAITGEQVPKGKVYRAIRALTSTDRSLAPDQPRKKATPIKPKEK